MFEVGRVCMKTAGREAGRYCVIIKKSEDGFVLVTGPRNLTRVKRRKCNINHLEPLMDKLKIKSEASDEEVLKAFKEEKIADKLGLKEVKAEHHKAEKPKEHKKAEPKKAEKKEEPKKAEPRKEAPKKKPEVKKPEVKKKAKPAAKKAKKK